MKRAWMLVAATAALSVVGALSTASAASISQVGWWTRSPAASAPEGGVAVANSVDGPVSVAAVMVDLGDGVVSSTLTLNQTGGAAPGGVQLVVCAVIAPWQPAAPGPIEEAPATTCDGTSATVTASDATWTADVQPLVADRTGAITLSVVPALGSTGIWDLQFEAPAFTATAAPASRSTVTTEPSASISPPTTTVAAYPSANVAAAPPTVVAPTATSVVDPAASTTSIEVEPVSASGEVAISRPAGTTDDGRPVGQAVTLVLVAAVIGVLGGVAHKVVTARVVS